MAEGQHGITRETADFISTTQFNDLPEAVVSIGKRCIIDGIGVILAGSGEACTTAVRKYCAGIAGRGESTILGKDSFKAPMHLAALINGTAGHALDWDDSALSKEDDRSVLIHPTMQPLCAALAVGENIGSSGKDFLTAFILGFEVACKIAESIHADHFTGGRGFHTSGTIGIFGATAAAAKLLGLSADRISNALGIAASMSSGIGVNHGTMVKPLQMGRAAENGIVATRLASLDMQANPVALEGPRGFFHCFGGGFHPDRISGKLGTPYSILEPGVSVKPYPCGVVGHPGMDAMGALVRQHDISPQDVAHVIVATGSSVIPPKGPLRYKKATTALEGKFCLPFQIAAMILRQKAGMMEFTDDFVQRPDVQDMMDRIETVVDPDIAALGHDKLIFNITVVLKNGKTFNLLWDKPYRGGPLNPLTPDELAAKFADASQYVLESATQIGLLDLLNSLDQLDSLSPVLALAAVPSQQSR